MADSGRIEWADYRRISTARATNGSQPSNKNGAIKASMPAAWVAGYCDIACCNDQACATQGWTSAWHSAAQSGKQSGLVVQRAVATCRCVSVSAAKQCVK